MTTKIARIEMACTSQIVCYVILMIIEIRNALMMPGLTIRVPCDGHIEISYEPDESLNKRPTPGDTKRIPFDIRQKTQEWGGEEPSQSAKENG